jgi:acetyl-CoA acetyltransferase
MVLLIGHRHVGGSFLRHRSVARLGLAARTLEPMNNFGCSLVWDHPQAPTALRSIIEVIKELVLRGGAYGLFTGCAAGDSAMAVVLKVSNR